METQDDLAPAAATTDAKAAPVAVGDRPWVSRNELLKTLAITPAKFARYVADGAPLIEHGDNSPTRRWRINLADFVKFMIADALIKVSKTRGDNNEGKISLDEAKRKDKQSQADIRELELLRLRGEMVSVEDIRPFLRESFAVTRSRLLSVPSQITGLDARQSRDLQDAINDALIDISETKAEDYEPNTAAAAKQPKH